MKLWTADNFGYPANLRRVRGLHWQPPMWRQGSSSPTCSRITSAVKSWACPRSTPEDEPVHRTPAKSGTTTESAATSDVPLPKSGLTSLLRAVEDVLGVEDGIQSVGEDPEILRLEYVGAYVPQVA